MKRLHSENETLFSILLWGCKHDLQECLYVRTNSDLSSFSANSMGSKQSERQPLVSYLSFNGEGFILSQ